jgi:hypothetical protein
MRLEEASAKVREGGPVDDAEDMGMPVWAGELPLSLVPGDPLADGDLPKGIQVPGYVRDWRRP